jgi:hypothetical protein
MAGLTEADIATHIDHEKHPAVLDGVKVREEAALRDLSRETATSMLPRFVLLNV